MADISIVPIEVPAALLDKVKAAAASVAPDKKVKITLSMDLSGNITATAGWRAKRQSMTATLGVFGFRDAATGKVGGAAQATIEFEPAP